MSRPRSANPRGNIVAVRLTDKEITQVDSERGPLSRSEWLRLLLLRHRKRP